MYISDIRQEDGTLKWHHTSTPVSYTHLKDAIAKVEALVKGDARISVATLKTKYPQGAERSLIYATTGRSINSSMLPADAGCIVDNVATIVAIKEAVKDGKPLYERVVTVTGDAIKNPSNFKVRTGTNVQELIEAAGGFKTQPEKIISGGPMMGMAMFTDVYKRQDQRI